MQKVFAFYCSLMYNNCMKVEKELVMTLDDVNLELAALAEEARAEQIELQYEELQVDEELLRQYEAMSYSAELENFSPFDNVNS